MGKMLVCFVFLCLLSYGDCGGLHLQGDYIISGWFPLHNSDSTIPSTPYLTDCTQGLTNKHGYHLVQAFRYAMDEINNGTQNKQLLPGVTLGYRTYDLCSLPASNLATLDLLAQQDDSSAVDSRTVAIIGPDSSSYSFTPSAALGAFLVPQISYEASNELLSNKILYPAFFRTIPSDKNQVSAMIQILVRFNWTWIALLGSDNPYGIQGMQGLSQQASLYNLCIAYQAEIPAVTNKTKQYMQDMVKNILKTKVNTRVVFANKRRAAGFFPFVIDQNVTGKVWIGTEDWSVASTVSSIPGISTIGTVLGVAVQYTEFSGFDDFERLSVPRLKDTGLKSPFNHSVPCMQNTNLYEIAIQGFSMSQYDIVSSFNVYKAVYAVAHALHNILQCDSGLCQKYKVQPWEVFHQLKRVRFSIRNTSFYFDKNGDPPTGYDIVTWVWTDGQWSFKVVGNYSPVPTELQLDTSQIKWTGQVSPVTKVPESLCSPECPYGHRKLMTGQHKCCFDCMACPAATFLNKTGYTFCQVCARDYWSEAESETCKKRAELYLPWGAPLTTALLIYLGVTLFLTLGTAVIFLFNLSTPVVKSAGGKTCLLMLASLTVASCSTLCHFNRPSHIGCLLKQPLFIISFTVCLACVTVRSFQVVCIFKWSSKLPRSYETWAKNRGPEMFIFITTVVEVFISLLRMLLDPPFPSRDYDFYSDSIILECSKTLSLGAFAELFFVCVLSLICFCLSYMGKDLPANYNEAKCITFSLMIYMISWITFFTAYCISRGSFAMALNVGAILFSVLGILGGYFLPKVYIIMIKPQLNTAAHFQNCIQMYTMSMQ
ncbi:taste receptor type 1 member 1-like [Sinocyclocheilus anshuiensis]|uniref:Taste receptor type 1 member 1-like n=1 Tax=Sinocyclocheilus anshuiensis TaxID=1608454 RepID=A0A671NG99_9TELE|nr:PREDICTED: taste receptor type 1 member 1-like [Sinocyclocheilus anshuiensis]